MEFYNVEPGYIESENIQRGFYCCSLHTVIRYKWVHYIRVRLYNIHLVISADVIWTRHDESSLFPTVLSPTVCSVRIFIFTAT